MTLPSPNDLPPASGSSWQTSGPYAPLPPSRRHRDIGVQWVVLSVTIAVMLVAIVVMLTYSKGAGPVPGPRTTPAPTYSQQDCENPYLDCPRSTFPR